METLADKREALTRKYESALIEARFEDIDALEIPFFQDNLELCGIRFRPVTLRMLRDLFASRSPFVCGGEPDFADTFIAAWYLSEHYSPSLIKRAWLWYRWRGKDMTELADAVKTVIGYAMRGAPKGKANNDESPQYSWMASIIHIIASTYGWTQDYILSLPSGAAWQYYRLIIEERRASAGKKTPPSAGKYESVMAEYLKEVNQLEAEYMAAQKSQDNG